MQKLIFKNSIFVQIFLSYTVLLLFITFYVLKIINFMGNGSTSALNALNMHDFTSAQSWTLIPRFFNEYFFKIFASS